MQLNYEDKIFKKMPGLHGTVDTPSTLHSYP